MVESFPNTKPRGPDEKTDRPSETLAQSLRKDGRQPRRTWRAIPLILRLDGEIIKKSCSENTNSVGMILFLFL